MVTAVGRVGPTPIGQVETAGQLRAGTGSFFGDIKQDAANMFLPERFAQQIIQNQNPGSTVEQDEDGNFILVRADGSRHFLNEPGLGAQDGLKVLGALGVAGGAGMIGAAAIPSAAAVLRAYGAAHPIISGAAAGATYSAAEQGVGDALTEGIDVSGRETANAGMFGALPFIGMKLGGKGLDALASATGIDALRTPIQSALAQVNRVLTPTGRLTKQAKEALEAAGIDPTPFTPAQIDAANRAAASATPFAPAAQGRQAALATEGITPTEGMTGQFPKTVLNETRGMNHAARRSAISDLQNVGDEMLPPQDFQTTTDALRALHGDRMQQADDLFTGARAASRGVELPSGQTAGFRQRLERGLKDSNRYDIEDIDEVFENFPSDIRTIEGPDGSTIMEADPTNVRKLFRWRKEHIASLPGKEAKQIFDAEIDSMIERGMVNDQGADALKAWRDANKDFADMSNTWSANDLLNKVIQKDRQGAQFKYSPQEISNLVFNSSDAGFVNKAGVRGFLKKTKELLGEDSEAYQAMAIELGRKALRLKGSFREVDESGSVVVKGVDMVNAWNAAKRDAGDILDEALPPDLMKRMDNFVEYARWMDTKIGQRANKTYSGPTHELISRAFNRMADAHFRLARSAFREAANVSQEMGTQQAIRQLYGDLYVPRGASIPKTATAVASEQIMTEEFDEILRGFDEILRGLGWDIPQFEPMTIPIFNGITDTQ